MCVILEGLASKVKGRFIASVGFGLFCAAGEMKLVEGILEESPARLSLLPQALCLLKHPSQAPRKRTTMWSIVACLGLISELQRHTCV